MRRNVAILIIFSGFICLVLGVGTWLPSGIASAMPAQQDPQPPPERPVVNPDPQPGGGGGGGGGGGSDDDVVVTPVPAGRITGTVINHSTGAPTANIEVSVGGVIVRSDANGNYERVHLFPGTYIVRLRMGADQGVALEDPRVVVLAEDENVFVHRYFRPAGAAAAAEQSVSPEPASVAATLVEVNTDDTQVTVTAPSPVETSASPPVFTTRQLNTDTRVTTNHSQIKRHTVFGRLRPF